MANLAHNTIESMIPKEVCTHVKKEPGYQTESTTELAEQLKEQLTEQVKSSGFVKAATAGEKLRLTLNSSDSLAIQSNSPIDFWRDYCFGFNFMVQSMKRLNDFGAEANFE